MAAENSSARPGPKNESVASSEPSTVTMPFATVDAPPAFQGVLVQPVGQGRATELAADGRREHDLAVPSLGEVRADVERPRTEVGRRRVDQLRERRRER